MKHLAILASMFVALLALTGCGDREKSVRFRITYTFDTPSGERSGAHVLEAYSGPCSGASMGPGCAQGLRGEAAVIDLGDGKTVFAILAMGPIGENVDGPIGVANAAYKGEIGALCKAGGGTVSGCTIFQVKTDTFPPRVLEPSQLFTMATFKDINDPKSAIVVHASGSKNPAIAAMDRVEQTFGQGFAFKGAVIEMATDAEITQGIEKAIPGISDPEQWNAPLRDLPWDQNRFLAGTGAFKRGSNLRGYN
jgi:hypothetical protein